jgi:malonate transporter
MIPGRGFLRMGRGGVTRAWRPRHGPRAYLRQCATVLNVLLITFPFFALVLAGYLAAKRGMLPLAAIPGLNGFVLFFALPAMLYRFGSTTPIAQLLDFSVAGVYLVCALIMVAFAIVWSLNQRIRWNDASLGALVAAFPNTGFMGVPLLAALLGPETAGPVIVLIVVDMVITSSLCVALSQLDGEPGDSGENGARAMVVAGRKALRGVVGNPMPWAILLGGVASALSFSLPGPVEKTVWLLADAASPVALFTIGAVLARSQIQANHPMPLSDYLPVSLMKLVLHPLLVLAVGTAAIQLGVPLQPFALTVMVLVSALPSASNVSLLAERLGADNGRIARIILVTTVAAFLSFSGAVALLT